MLLTFIIAVLNVFCFSQEALMDLVNARNKIVKIQINLMKIHLMERSKLMAVVKPQSDLILK